MSNVIRFPAERVKAPHERDPLTYCRVCGGAPDWVYLPKVDHRRRIETWPRGWAECNEHHKPENAS